MLYKVVVDIYPQIISKDNPKTRYVFGVYRTKREADNIAKELNALKNVGKAKTVEVKDFYKKS